MNKTELRPKYEIERKKRKLMSRYQSHIPKRTHKNRQRKQETHSHYGHDSRSETQRQEFSVVDRTSGHRIDGGYNQKDTYTVRQGCMVTG